jgi:hypothetical protein
LRVCGGGVESASCARTFRTRESNKLDIQ